MKTPISKDGYFLGMGLLFGKMEDAGVLTFKRARVLILLAVSVEGFGTLELAKRLGMRRDCIYKMITELSGLGLVVREQVVGGHCEYVYRASCKTLGILGRYAPGPGAEGLEKIVSKLNG
jgi:predicted DNA-binding transcriptional regulator